MFDERFKKALKSLILSNAEDISKEYNQQGMSWEEKRLLKKAIKEKAEKDAKEEKKENKRPRT